MMEFTAEMIAGFLGGQVAGDKEAKVHTVSSIEEGEPGALTYLTNPKYEKHLYKTRASIVLVNKDFTPSEPVTATLIKVEDTGAAVLKLLQMYQAAKPRKQGISERASISERATLGEDCYVGDFAVIEAGARIGADCQIYPQVYIGDGVTVGDGTILYPGVKIYEGCVIGSRCILHAGAVIGADGFGFLPNAEGGFDKIPQLGNVVIEDDVEIGANTCIDRAKTDSTVIRRGVKLDNLIQIGHNVQIGYFAQNQASLLDENLTVFQTIDDVAKGEIRNKIRDLLGAFMFGGPEESMKKVKVLSGGERTRLAMIKLLLEPVNLLILDEPTNHLDMKTKDILKQALLDFDGTLILVSHDRDFLDGLVSKVYEFGNKQVKEHLSGIYEFLEKKKMDSLRELER